MEGKMKFGRWLPRVCCGLGVLGLLFLFTPRHIQAAGVPKAYQAEDAIPGEGDKPFYEEKAFWTGAGEASEKTEVADTKALKGEWITKNQRTYYRIEGKKQKGIQEINGKTYFFDSRGIQRTGWQKIEGEFYFFRIANGKKGYMEKATKRNGITLKKNGKAKLTESSLAKLDVLIKANKIVEKVTKPGMSKSEKLKKCYQYAKKEFQYRGSPKFQGGGRWELDYALDMFDQGHGSCYAYGAAMAFLADAVGYENCYAISSGGHGWAEIEGRVYDISWDLVDRKHNYYALSYELSGVDGRPNYKNARKYVKKIN